MEGAPIFDGDRPSSGATSRASTVSPREIDYLLSGQARTPINVPSGAYPDRNIRSPYDRIGALYDPTRQEGRAELHSPRSAQSSNLPPLSIVELAAQLALSNRTHTQKEEMLAGRHYFPFDEELVLERERLNNRTNPDNRMTPEER
jgi:hypothetical protein